MIGAITVAVTTLFSWKLLLNLSANHDGPVLQNLSQYFHSHYGLYVAPHNIVLLPQREGLLSWREIFFLGTPSPQVAKDTYFAQVLLSDRGVAVYSSPFFSISKTKAASEQDLQFDGGHFLAYASAIDHRSSVITILDLRGQSPLAVNGFSWLHRLQQRITNWQETGRWDGLDYIEVQLPIPQQIKLVWKDRYLHIQGKYNTWEVIVDPYNARVIRGAAQARQVRVGKRSFLAWAVDTVRAISWIGPEKIAWLEERVYGVVDKARRISGTQVTAMEIKDEMDLPMVDHSAGTRIDHWPPAPLPLLLRDPLKGEGQWLEVQGPFLRRQPGMPSFFAMTFVRPDSERLFAKVYFVAWDPRRLDLQMVGGTAEPRSATGELGRGIIPRDTKLLPRLVAAFNGGFQSMHGDFGMMEDRKVLCPPKPWAATVAHLADGATGFGTWDGQAEPHWVPEWIHSFRQNLTPFVEDGLFNPWRRGSWGGGAGFLTGSGPKAFIIRSALCLHKDGYIMYAMGDPVDGPTLGKALHKVGCNYALELDINKGHVGFEFYNVLAPGETPPAEAKHFVEEKYFARSGRYPELNELRYYMREVTRGTGNSPVPRYIGREARDFFYLTVREMLPGEDLTPLGSSNAGKSVEGHWTTATLPSEAIKFPLAMNRTFLHPNKVRPNLRIHLFQLDLRWLDTTLCLPKEEAGCLPRTETVSADKPLAILPLGSFSDTRALIAGGKLLQGKPGKLRSLVLRPLRPDGPALASISATPQQQEDSISIQSALPPSSATFTGNEVKNAICAGKDGRLFYATGLGANDADLNAALKHAGCKNIVPLGSGEPLLIAKDADGNYETPFGALLPTSASSPSLFIRRSSAAWAPRIFTHVKPQPRSVWTLVQPERTRASALHRAKKTAQALGLPPPKNLSDLCHPPYAEVKELREYRWRDVQTGKVCGENDDPISTFRATHKKFRKSHKKTKKSRKLTTQ